MSIGEHNWLEMTSLPGTNCRWAASSGWLVERHVVAGDDLLVARDDLVVTGDDLVVGGDADCGDGDRRHDDIERLPSRRVKLEPHEQWPTENTHMDRKLVTGQIYITIEFIMLELDE